MDKKMVSVILWALGCLGILLAPGHAITVAAEVACAAAIIILGKVFQESKLQDFVAALLLHQVLLALNSVWVSRVLAMEGQAEASPGLAGKALWVIGLLAGYLICVAGCAWLRGKIGQERKRSLMASRCKYIAAFLVMLLGLASNGWAVVASAVFLALLITDGQYYRMGGYQMKKLILPLAAVLVLVIAWMTAVDYMELSLWQIAEFPQKMKDEFSVACGVGCAYVFLLFCGTFRSGAALPSRKATDASAS